MKKFYNSPVVEITVFDVEDIITASAISTEQYVDENGQVDAAFATEVKTNTGVTTTGWSSTYTW